MKTVRFAASLIMVVSLSGCGANEDSGDSQQQVPEGEVERTVEQEDTEGAADRHRVRGKVVAVDPEKPSVTLDHEEIPGLMGAMKMEFPVEDAQVLGDLEAGDQVEGQLVEKEGQHVITELQQRSN